MENTRDINAAGLHLKDSGAREEMPTGSRRDTRIGKGRFDLLPARGLRALAILFEAGAVKYGDRNWEKGQPLARYLDSGLRHATSVLQGLEDEDHLRAAAWNFLCALDTRERIKEGVLPAALDDLPYPPINLCPPESSGESLARLLECRQADAPTTSPANMSGEPSKDLRGEIERIYTFPCGTSIRIAEPLELWVSKNGHRIADAEGNGHYIPMGWIRLTWKNKPGIPAVQF